MFAFYNFVKPLAITFNKRYIIVPRFVYRFIFVVSILFIMTFLLEHTADLVHTFTQGIAIYGHKSRMCSLRTAFQINVYKAIITTSLYKRRASVSK